MWKLETNFSDTKCVDGVFIKGCFWNTTIDYDDGLIIVSGEADNAHDSIIKAMEKLTYKGQVLFSKYAYETKQIMSFFWINHNTFVSCGKVYEIEWPESTYCIRDLETYCRVRLQDIQFDKVKLGRTHPIVKVTKRIEEIKAEWRKFDKALSAWESTWIDGQ